jgi:ATP-dependent RNA helicase RhlE
MSKSKSTAQQSENPISYFQKPKKKKEEKIDPERLIKKAIPLKSEHGGRKFDDLSLDARFVSNLTKKGLLYLTEIQDKTFELITNGTDVLGIDQTGSGKTAAYLVPLIQRMLKQPKDVMLSVLVMVPTRELAEQVEQEFRSITKDLKLYATSFVGGIDKKRDLKKLGRKYHLVVATPGRLLDMHRKNEINIRRFSVLIFDEFDRMLDMGFVKEIDQLKELMQHRSQTLLFSATKDKTQRYSINELMKNQVEILVSSGEITADHIEQDIISIGQKDDKLGILIRHLKSEDCSKALIFVESQVQSEKIAFRLAANNIKAEALHGALNQLDRKNILKAFKTGVINVLVATDVAARGIDVADVTHVFNYQIPRTYSNYIHRIGRTGRAGKSGYAFTFIVDEEGKYKKSTL